MNTTDLNEDPERIEQQTAANDNPKVRRWPLAEARRLAEHMQRELAGLCDRIEIAGSIRRQRPDVHDIDLVLLLKPGARPALEQRIRQSANTRIEKNGPQNIIIRLHNGMQVDLYLAKPTEHELLGPIPSNFGMRLLAMTGSKEHNVKLAKLAKEKGLHFHPYRGLMRPLPEGGGRRSEDSQEPCQGEEFDATKWEVFCSEHEAAIFEALGLPYIKPEEREC